jgi:hypothetical protein
LAFFSECIIGLVCRRRISLLKLAMRKTIVSQPRETFQPPRQQKGRRRPNSPPLIVGSLCLLGLCRRRISLLKLVMTTMIVSQPQETFQPPRQQKGRRRPNSPPLIVGSLCLRWVMLSPQRQLLRLGQVRRSQRRSPKSRLGTMVGRIQVFLQQLRTHRQFSVE